MTRTTHAWPYDWQKAQETLIPNVIREQGKYLLNRALNMRSVIAFVGTGVSMAYGRTSWAELATRHTDVILAWARGALQEDRKDIADDRRLVCTILRQMRDKLPSGGGDEAMRAFQLGEQVWALSPREETFGRGDSVRDLARRFGIDGNQFDEFSSRYDPPELGRQLFRVWVKQQTGDELALIENLLTPLKRLIPSNYLDVAREHASRFGSWAKKHRYRLTDDERKALSPDTRGRKRIHRAFRQGQKLWIKVATRKPANPDLLLSLAQWFGIDLAQFNDLKKRKISRANLGLELFRLWVREESSTDLRLILTVTNGKVDPLPHYRDAVDRFIPKPRLLDREEAAARNQEYLWLFGPVFIADLVARIDRIDGTVTSKWEFKVAKSAASILKRYLDSNPQPRLAPTQYYAVGLVLQLLVTCCTDDGVRAMVKDCIGQAWADRQGAMAKGKHVAALDMAYDPLSRLAGDLDISRFMTTNYDLEIERWLTDSGYRLAPPDTHRPESPRPPGHDFERYGRLGARIRDFALNDQSAVELIDFAANEAPYDYQVVHVHGRATAESDVVVTERDYQLKYHLDRPPQKIMEEGLQVTFGGNPILFVGFNLAEGDVQRPLREFVARTSRRNRSLIGLRVAFSKRDKRDAATMDMYAKFGIHLLHFGFTGRGSELEDRPPAAASSEDPDNSWFLCFCELHEAVRQGGDWAKKWQVLEASLPKVDLEGNRGWPFISDGGNCDFRLELRLLKLLAEETRPVSMNKQERDAFDRTLVRLYDSVHMAALGAKLHGMVADWREWWERWRQDPADRTGFSGRVPVRPSDPPRIGRHVVPHEVGAIPPSMVLDALHRCSASSKGRRVYVLASRRGVGAGSIFSHLYEPMTSVFGGRDRRYAASFFANIGFSCEVASVWDELSRFLLDRGRASSSPAEAATARRTYESLGRLERLQFALERAGRQRGNSRRLLVVLTAFDVLFERGNPKNTEIGRVCELLLGRCGASAPVDFVLFVREDNLPLHFRYFPVRGVSPDRLERTSRHAVKLVVVGDAGDEHRHGEVRGRLERLGVLLETDNKAPRDADLRKQRDDTVSEKRPIAHSEQDRDETFLIALAPDRRAIGKLLSPADKLLRKALSSSTYSLVQIVGQNRYLAALLSRVATVGDSSQEARQNSLARAFQSVTAPSASPINRVLDEVVNFWTSPDTRKYGALDQSIIKHLAVIGIPVGAIVLAECPEVIDNCQPDADDREDRRLQVIGRVEGRLEELKRSGLVLEIETRPPTAFRTLPDNHTIRRMASKKRKHVESRMTKRYTVHRLIQLFVYRQLGAQRVEPADTFFFSVSLYASQTRELPTLSANSYRFIHGLVLRLIRYPAVGIDPAPDYWTASEGLRAALGVVRTLFSIGVVSRFHELMPHVAHRPPDMGYFEQHRLAIRWMLRYATEIESVYGHEIDRGSRGGKKPREVYWRPPFYRDELMWLYNECAVFSMTQGGTQDAVALFERALNVCRSIEGVGGGAMKRRIQLNAALCDIDRGRFSAARVRLRECLIEPDEDPLIRAVAVGYRALVDHLSGNLEKAALDYEEACATLQRIDRPRAASIFYRHWGDLLRHRGDAEARSKLQTAVRLAEGSGFEDIAHHARISLIRLTLEAGGELKNSIKDLRAAEAYADVMDIPKLKCDALMARAEVLMKQNETGLAGEFVTRALRIATLNGLTLRKVAFMLGLSRVYTARELLREAEQLRRRTIREARYAGYHLVIERAEGDSAGIPQVSI